MNKHEEAEGTMRQGIAKELHRTVRKNFLRRRVEIKSLNDLFAADLVEMIPYAKINKNYKYILTMINCFSKYAYAIPLKTKTGKEVAKVLESIFSQVSPASPPPHHLHTDQGKEFYNSDCKRVFDKYKINHYSTYSAMKSPIIERFNRTLKNMMYTEFSARGSYKYLDILPVLVDRYNHSYHRTIGCAPIDVTPDNESEILERIRRNTDRKANPIKFTENENIRISKHKALFEKGYTPSWSGEIFNIAKVQDTKPVTYLLKDYQGNEIKGGFYSEELAKTKHPNEYLVEKVVKRKGNRLFVKWLGFDSSHNSWIHKDDILK